MYVHICVCVNARAHRGQKCSIPLDLELWEVVNPLTWVLGIKLPSSAEAVLALCC